MRQASHDVGWLESEPDNTPKDQAPTVFGFALGYDFCAQHEWGIPFLREALGLPEKEVPVGIEDRTITKAENLGFLTYQHRSRDKRVKKTMPAALLYCSDRLRFQSEAESSTPDEIAHRLGASFSADFAKDLKWYKPARDDIVSAWASQSGFAIHVRGEENVKRLTDLHEAFLAHSVSIAGAATMGFSRNALSLVMNNRLPPETFKSVREADEAHVRLLAAVQQSGIEDRLKAAGRNYYGLMPRWADGEGSQLLFFLNPREQKLYSHGWFSVEELDQWIAGTGPVFESDALKPLVTANDKDWGIHLIYGLRLQDCGLARAELFVWLNKNAGKIGVVLDFYQGKAPDGLTPVRDNIYALEDVEPLVAKGRELSEERTRAREQVTSAAEAAGNA